MHKIVFDTDCRGHDNCSELLCDPALDNSWSYVNIHVSSLPQDMVSGISQEIIQNMIQDLLLAHKVISSGTHNIFGCRIPIRSNWNIELMESLLVDYPERMVTEFLKYSFPISYPFSAPDPLLCAKNHRGADWFPGTIDWYVLTEIMKGATIRLF